MKTLVLLFAVLAVASSATYYDWSQYKRIEELDSFWEQLAPELQALRPTSSAGSRIVGGQEASPNQFPYQVAVLSIFGEAGGICGGTVLTNNFILSAAHCLRSGTTDATEGQVILGAHNRVINEPTQQRIDFGSFTIHESYIATFLRNDIATIRLATPATFTPQVQPINLPALSEQSRTFAGMVGWASGFGRTSDDNQFASNVVYYTTNPIMTNADCVAIWGSSLLIGAQNICLSAEGGRSVCNGDSGGPLAVREAIGSVQVGIASFVHANGCASGHPSGFVRVTHFLNWIATNSDVVLRQRQVLQKNRYHLLLVKTIKTIAPIECGQYFLHFIVGRSNRGELKRAIAATMFFRGLLLGVIVVTMVSKGSIVFAKPPARSLKSSTYFIKKLPFDLRMQSAVVPAIAGGVVANGKQFPFQVAILVNFPDGSGTLCGGVLISEEYLLSASHCLGGAIDGTVIVGTNTISFPGDPAGIEIPVTFHDMLVHPKYNPVDVTNDIAILRLPIVLKLSDRVKPIRLPSKSEAQMDLVGVEATVSGWGALGSEEYEEISEDIKLQLRFVSNPVISNEACEKVFPNMIHGFHVCVSGEHGRNACQGDSGGPLTAVINGQTTLIGVVSYGSIDGCENGFPAVYSRVGAYLDWISYHTNVPIGA
ncbi:transmembrane protease serine 9-like [Uranotaenia lowii]|uniref:transmembrane protease serine 9-like n=1 Tax=Uranotaenia lowii TaxID=190385 RepID=UPI00247945D2|nr:transmembrane protease serine 9-like [Uranotaenia lowii]